MSLCRLRSWPAGRAYGRSSPSMTWRNPDLFESMRSGRSPWRTLRVPPVWPGVSFVVLDTDVASASFRGRLADPLRARLTGQTWCVSFVTLGELTKWKVMRSWGPRKRAELAGWLDNVVILPYSEAVAVTWGELQARAVRGL